MGFNISQMKEGLRICRKAGNPLMVWGPGGVGKSEGIEQVAEEDNIEYLCIEAPTREPVDVVGVLAEEGEFTVWKRPKLLPIKGAGILHIDELPDASIMLMKALYHLILKNEVAGHKVSKEWYIVGSGNRPEDSLMAADMPAPLITRFTHIGVCCETPDFSKRTPKEAMVDIEDWRNWALKKNIHPFIISFINNFPHYIYHHQSVPRTLEYASNLLYATSPTGFIIGELIKGTIGSGVGLELNSFLKLTSEFPDIKELLKNPKQSKIPKNKSILFAVVTSLIQQLDKKTEDPIIIYVERLPNEYQFYFFKSAILIDPDLIKNKKYITWIGKNREVLMSG